MIKISSNYYKRIEIIFLNNVRVSFSYETNKSTKNYVINISKSFIETKCIQGEINKWQFICIKHTNDIMCMRNKFQLIFPIKKDGKLINKLNQLEATISWTALPTFYDCAINPSIQQYTRTVSVAGHLPCCVLCAVQWFMDIYNQCVHSPYKWMQMHCTQKKGKQQ